VPSCSESSSPKRVRWQYIHMSLSVIELKILQGIIACEFSVVFPKRRIRLIFTLFSYLGINPLKTKRICFM
jgi:hypothetical protein